MEWHYRDTVLGLCTFTYFGTRICQLVLSPLVPEITTAYDISQGTIGIALTGMWIAYALTQLPSGLLGDRYGERPIILLALGIASLTCLLLALAPSFPIFAVLVVLLGAGVGLQYNVSVALLTDHFEMIGRVLGIYRTGGQIAGLAVPVTAAAVSVQFGWRVAILLGTVVCVPTFVLFISNVHRTPTSSKQPLSEQLAVNELTAILSRPAIAIPTAIAVLAEFVNMATISFLPTFLVVFHGFSLERSALFFSGFFVVTTLFLPVSGWISDRFTCDGTIALLLSVGAVGYVLLFAGSSLLAVVAGIVCIGVGMSWDPAVQSRFIDNLTATDQARGFGMIRTVYILLGALGSVVTGMFADLMGWGIAFAFLGIVLLGAV